MDNYFQIIFSALTLLGVGGIIAAAILRTFALRLRHDDNFAGSNRWKTG